MIKGRCHPILLFQMLVALCFRAGAASRSLSTRRISVPAFALPSRCSINPGASSRCSTTSTSTGTITSRLHSSTDTKDTADVPTETPDDKGNEGGGEPDNEKYIPPWSMPSLKEQSSSRSSRYRQHVNPLARRYQMEANLPDNWPYSDFNDVNLPLYLDIGCSKGGFLLELVGRRHGSQFKVTDDSYMNTTKVMMEDTTDELLPPTMNYLGLEIRPGVSQYAQARVKRRGLDGSLSFVGCNANVDLDRLLTLYQDSAGKTSDEEGSNDNNRPAFVSIQFPDPHFKKAHSKRRVVTPQLVTTLAKFMNEGDAVFLQSDVLDALESMRERFVEDDGSVYFDERQQQNNKGEQEEYGMDNPLGIPTEREVSVLKKGLPVYRTLFKRNGVVFE